MMEPLAVERVAWDLVVPHVDPGDYAAARLTCRELQLALDGNSSTAASKIRLASWSGLHTPVTLQHSIKHLEAHVSSTQDWLALQQFLQDLPQLCSLSCTGRRTWPPQLSRQDSSSVVPHSHLRGANFEGFLTSLVELSALAPHLDTLCCSTLVLQQPGVGCSSSRSAPGSLPCCRRFAADAVKIAAHDEAAASEAFAAALPQLQVLCDLPEFTWSIPKGDHMTRALLPVQQALRCCSSLIAARAFGTSTEMGGLLSVQLQDMTRLECLSVYGVGPAVELLGISRLTQLVALSLAYEPDRRTHVKLLREVASLPRLQLLALPAKLLCTRCCSGIVEHLQALLLLLRPRVQGRGASTASHGTNNSCEPFQQLRRLIFLVRSKAQHRRYQCGDFCQHHSPEGLQLIADERITDVKRYLAREAAAAQGQLQGPSSQPQDKGGQLHLLMSPLQLQACADSAREWSVEFVQLGPEPEAYQPVPAAAPAGAGVSEVGVLSNWFD